RSAAAATSTTRSTARRWTGDGPLAPARVARERGSPRRGSGAGGAGTITPCPAGAPTSPTGRADAAAGRRPVVGPGGQAGRPAAARRPVHQGDATGGHRDRAAGGAGAAGAGGRQAGTHP